MLPLKNQRIILKDTAKEIQLFINRAIIMWLLIVTCFGIIITRLVYLQVIEHDKYTTLSENNRIRQTPIPPTRGLIYDRNGVLLATNRATHTLEIYPRETDDIEKLFTDLQAVINISEDDIKRFHRLKKHKRRFEPVPLRFHLNEEEVARFSVKRHQFKGAKIESTLTRYYPLGASGVHAIGYVGRINERELKKLDYTNYRGSKYIGKTGIEKFYESTLHGVAGYEQVETNVKGRVLRVLERTQAIPGKNLYLNIDMSLQNFAEYLIKDERAAIVAIEPDNGAVLALASMPYYNPNLFVNGIDTKTYHGLRDSPDRPLFNRALRGQYPPGSTIKALVGLAGLEYGVRSEASSTWCPGWYRIKDQKHRFRDWKRSGHGRVNFHHAVEQSCDVYFYDLAHDLGIDRLHSFMSRFGFGKRTGIDSVGELRGLMPSREWKQRRRKRPWYPGETLITGIGQGFMLTTPLQLSVATAILGTRGRVKQPRIVFSIDTASSNMMRIVDSSPRDDVTLKNSNYWNTAIKSMEAVVVGSRGTARKIAKGSEYRFAGKTGTAQVFGIKQDARYDASKIDKRLHDHALFVSFAPLDNPKIAVAVIVENGGSGSSTAAPIAKKIMDYYLLPHAADKFNADIAAKNAEEALKAAEEAKKAAEQVTP